MTVFDAIPVDRISTQAREVNFARTLLTILAAVFYAIGWTAAKIVAFVWLGIAWSAIAIKVGWQDARQGGPPREPR